MNVTRRYRQIATILAACTLLVGIVASFLVPGVINLGMHDGFGGGLVSPSTASIVFENYHTWGGSNDEETRGIWVDMAGNVYTCGESSSWSAGAEDAVLLKWSPSGTLLWNRSWGGTLHDSFNEVWGDGAGNIYVCGDTNIGASDSAITFQKWDGDGNNTWNKTYNTASVDSAESCWGDSQGNIYTYGTLGIGTNDDGQLIKWNSTGDVLWTRQWGNSLDDYAYDLWIDENDSIYTVTSSNSTMEPNWQAVITRWNSSGDMQWNASWGNAGVEEPCCILGDNDGNLFVTGYTQSMGSNPMDMFLVKYASNGTMLWNGTWGDSGVDAGLSLWVASGGILYVTGNTETSGANPNDIFLQEYTIATMDRVSSQLWGTTGEESMPIGKSIKGAPGGIIYFVATTATATNGKDLALVRFKPSSVPPETPDVPGFPVEIVFLAVAAGLAGGCVPLLKRKQCRYTA